MFMFNTLILLNRTTLYILQKSFYLNLKFVMAEITVHEFGRHKKYFRSILRAVIWRARVQENLFWD